MNASQPLLNEVAFCARKRHLQALLDQAREVRSELSAARRCRHRRAHLIRLARKHHLKACLTQLRSGGMTLQSGYDCLYFTYEPRATRIYWKVQREHL